MPTSSSPLPELLSDRVVRCLRDSYPLAKNRYQVAVSLFVPVSAIVNILEHAVSEGTIQATGDVGAPNERLYRFAPPGTASPACFLDESQL